MSNRLLITGSHSSGKGWISRILLELGFSRFCHEPLNPYSPPGIWPGREKESYIYCDRNSPPSKKKDLQKRLFELRGLPISAKLPSTLDYLSLIKRSTQRVFYYKDKRVPLVIKDPFSLFIADFMYHNCQVNPWIIIRNPPEFVANSVRMKISFSIDSVTGDPEFRDKLGSFFKAVEVVNVGNYETELIHNNVIYWILCAHQVINLFQYLTDDDNWCFSLLEKVNFDPACEIQVALNRLGYCFTEAQIRKALENSSEIVTKGSIRGLAQTRDMLIAPSRTAALSPLTPRMIDQINFDTNETYSILKQLEQRHFLR